MLNEDPLKEINDNSESVKLDTNITIYMLKLKFAFIE